MPDFLNARISGEPTLDVIGDEEWLQTSFTNTVATRGGALIKKWGRSSAASTAVSIADAIKVWAAFVVLLLGAADPTTPEASTCKTSCPLRTLGIPSISTLLMVIFLMD